VNPVPKWCHLGVWFEVHSNRSANSAIGGQRSVTEPWGQVSQYDIGLRQVPAE
jgi:hypothetical protein